MASFTSVLKKIGIVLLDGAQIATQVLGFPFLSQLLSQVNPKAGQIINTVVSDWNTLAGILSTAEAMFPSVVGAQTGPAKLNAAAPLVQQALLTWASSSLPGHSKVKDSQKLADSARAIASGFADFLNSLGE